MQPSSTSVSVESKALRSVFEDVLRAIEDGRVKTYSLAVNYNNGQILRLSPVPERQKE